MNDSYAVLGAEIQPDEKILWAGQPRQGLMFRWFDVPLSLFFLVWMLPSFTVFSGEETTASDGVASVFLLVPFLFLTVGLYMLIGRFLHDAWRRSHIHYGLSDHRAIIVDKSTVRSTPISGATQLQLKKHKGEFGTISIGSTDSWFGSQFSDALKVWSGVPFGTCFERIKDSRKVYDMMLQIKSS